VISELEWTGNETFVSKHQFIILDCDLCAEENHSPVYTVRIIILAAEI
jgi:hypothetical protein